MTPYERIPYEGAVSRNTDPAHLSLVSRWHGGPSAPISGFHLTELGCGHGTNLLPLAFYRPESTFLGIDSSASALEDARRWADQLELSNVRFLLKDLRELPPSGLRPSDYIIAHGLYSWVREDVRSAILEFSVRNLERTGLAYVSYNAQPGWSMRKVVRDTLLRFGTIRDARLEEKALRAIDLARQLLEDLPSREYAHSVLLAEELQRVSDGRPGYVFHEYLSDVNEGFWIGEVIASAERHGLAYVTDAQFGRWEGHVPNDLTRALQTRALDRVEGEELTDLLANRFFRASLLCREDAPRSAASEHDLVRESYVATSLRAETGALDLSEGVVERFRGQELGGAPAPVVTLETPMTKAAVSVLGAQWPSGLRVDALRRQACELLGKAPTPMPGADEPLIDDVATLFRAGQVEVRLREPSHGGAVEATPMAHRLARLEAEHRTALTTAYHVPLPLSATARAVLRELNGALTREALAERFDSTVVDSTLATAASWGLLDGG